MKAYFDARLDALRLSTKTDIAEARADMMKWMMFVAMGFQTVVIIGAVLALLRFRH